MADLTDLHAIQDFDKATLPQRLTVKQGPLPTALVKKPDLLCDLAAAHDRHDRDRQTEGRGQHPPR
ncbi:hypothetical protein [Streptomyces sp. VNUA116]|uniref:hypothetical protein n=1 Tax=Streptomyces sp. VNUA116 TaxID=3062449 RepID=UPI00349FD9C7